MLRISIRSAFAAVCMIAFPLASACADDVTATDVFVSHIFTLAADTGEVIALHVRHVVGAQATTPAAESRKVVLFIHGATVPSTAAFGLDYKDYNWLAFLARAGFDVWAMDMSGYGASARPTMDDPCNTGPKQQQIILKHPLAETCAPHYPFKFKSSRDDWAEIDSVVDHIHNATGASKVSLVAWSAGGSRAGGYAALHPDKVDRIFFYAPGGPKPGYKSPEKPEAGFPIALQTRADLEQKRWDPDARCPGQVEPGVRDALWPQIMRWDHVGASWGPEEGVMRGPTMSNGWSPDMASSLKMPVMVIVGEYDTPEERHKVFEAVGSADKVFLKVACASHFMVWEKQHKTLQNASLAWLRDGKFQGASHGEFAADAGGKVNAAK